MAQIGIISEFKSAIGSYALILVIFPKNSPNEERKKTNNPINKGNLFVLEIILFIYNILNKYQNNSTFMQNINNNLKNQSMPFKWTNGYLHQLLTLGKHKIITNNDLSAAFELVDRADFVPQEFQDLAYMDYDLDIGYGCTLDKPTVIAQIIEYLNPRPYINVLDIGTGSGYVAALIAVACGKQSQVISIDRVQFLVDIARLNIAKYPDLSNVKIYLRDGTWGLADRAPFDMIHISAAFETIPEEIQNQLEVGGRLVGPTTDGKLHLIERVSQNEFRETIKTILKFDRIKSGIG